MSETSFKVLLVEDDEATRRFMHSMLRSQGFEVIEACDGQQGWERAQSARADLIVTDIMMPGLNGIELCRRIKSEPALQLVPVILCTALNQEKDRLQGLDAGADDFLTKPVNETELRARLNNHRRVVQLQADLNQARLDAEALVAQRTHELRRTIQELHHAQAETAIAQLDVLHRLAAATEYKDSDTGAHIQRIAQYTILIGRCLGWFDDGELMIVSQASMMHDLGKIGIPDYILMKPGLLSSEEFEEMKNHTILGWRLLSGGTTSLLQTAAVIARSHHEKWDGSGYPDGVGAEEIPPEARIVAVVDVFDALRAQRCYKPEYPIEQCFEMIQARSGRHFDPEVVEAFMLCKEDLTSINNGFDPAEAA